MKVTDLNEKNKIKVRQIAFFYLAFVPATKLVFMPSNISAAAGEQFWVSLVANFLIDGLIILSVLFLSEKNPQTTLYDGLKKEVGAVAAKAVYAILALFFFIKSVVPLLETKLYVETTLYEMVPERITFYPFFIVSAYLSVKGLKILGRCSDFAVWFTVVGIVTALLLSVGAADFSNLLPLIQKPSYNLVNASFRSAVWHADSAFIIVMTGHFKPERAYKTKIMSGYAAGAILTIVFFVTFYGVYGAIAPAENFALPDISVFSVIVTNIGRFDFISVFLLLFSQVFAISVPLVAATKCVERVFGLDNSIIPAITVNLSAAAVTAVFSDKVFAVLGFFQNCFGYVFLILTAAILISLAFVVSKRRAYETTSD